jgi:two-component system response regulator DesR
MTEMETTMYADHTETQGLTCLVADDHRALVKLLARTLEDRGLNVVGRVCDGNEALERILTTRPDVAILDLQMPGTPVWEIVKRAAEETPDTAVLIYTGNGAEALVEESLVCGARGVVQKEASLDELMQAIEVVARGGSYVDPFQAAALAEAYDRDTPVALTRPERDALQLLAEGLREAEIARRLATTPDAVRASSRSAMHKLGAMTQSHAVAKAVRLGLIA